MHPKIKERPQEGEEICIPDSQPSPICGYVNLRIRTWWREEIFSYKSERLLRLAEEYKNLPQMNGGLTPQWT